MNEKIRKIVKSFLVITIAGFIVSFLYISLANKEIKKKTIELPTISSYDYDYYDLESKIEDLENRIDEIEYRADDTEGRADDNESNISDLESRVGDLEWELGY